MRSNFAKFKELGVTDEHRATAIAMIERTKPIMAKNARNSENFNRTAAKPSKRANRPQYFNASEGKPDLLWKSFAIRRTRHSSKTQKMGLFTILKSKT